MRLLKYGIFGIALAVSEVHAAKIFEWNDPIQGNYPSECSAIQTYSSGGGGYLYKQYKVECPFHIVMVDWTKNVNTNACTMNSTSSGYTISVSNCDNWRVHATAQPLPTRAETSGEFPAPTSFISPLGASGLLWTYTTSQPTGTWMNTGYSTSGWSTGYAGFYSGTPNPGEQNNTQFSGGNLWLRATLNLSSTDVNKVMFWGRWDDQIEIYINGVAAASKVEWVGSYQYIGMTLAAKNALQTGNNLIAVRLTNTGDPGYFNLAIARNGGLASGPVTGFTKNKNLGWVTDHIRSVLNRETIPASTLAITQLIDGKMQVIYSAGFGYMDKAQTRPVRQDAVFRLASTDKTPTWVALRDMVIDDGSCPGLGISTIVVSGKTVTNPLTNDPMTCGDSVKDIMVEIGVLDENEVVPGDIGDITIEHLLTYKDFFTPRPDQQNASAMTAYYNHLGITESQTSAFQLMRWYFTNPTLQTPGSSCPGGCYNSDGAAVARYLVDYFGGGMENFLRNDLMSAPVNDVFIAHERVEGRQFYANGLLREPWYRTETSPFPFWVGLEDALALSASAETLALTFPEFPYGLNWGNGGMSGTISFVRTLEYTKSSQSNTLGIAWLMSGGSDRIVAGTNGSYTDQGLTNLLYLLEDMPIAEWASLEQGRIRHVQTGYCIHPSGGSSTPADGTPALIYNDCNSDPRLNFRYAAEFGLQQVSSSKCLHPEGGATYPISGKKVVYHSGCDENRLDFKIMLDGTLMHVPSGKCVVPESSQNGALLKLQVCSNSANMKFEFVSP
ncbi:MAG: serine hydrolase [Cellvibrionaceae bacterium]|nr:serine hydrolase [Cellvibrionaceae bacterium]